MRISNLFALLLVVILFACEGTVSEIDASLNAENNTEVDADSWAISVANLTGSDNPFPYAAMPAMSPVTEVEGLKDDDQVILVSFKTEIKAYPLKFIAPFEVVNDELEGVHFGISYCPVTETTLCTENKNGNEPLSLVASGYRQLQNIIVKDINSNSYWTQMLIRYVKGPYVNQSPKTLPMIETSWSIVKAYFPDAVVFTSNSISSKAANSKRKSGDFGIDERIYGVLNESDVTGVSVSIIGFDSYDNTIKVYNQIIGSNNIVVFGSRTYNFITAFETEISDSYTPVQNKFPIIMKDAAGSEYNVFGIAVNGPNAGKNLTAPRSYLASWWAWQEFYSNFNEF